MKYLRFLAAFCALVLTFSCVSQQVVEERQSGALLLLNESAQWVITEGIGKYYASGGDFSVIYKPLSEKGVRFYFREVRVRPDSFIEWLSLWDWWVITDITCYDRIEHGETIYEYWDISRGSKRPDFDQWHIRFLVTRADSLKSPRKVIHESDRFFPEWVVSEDVVIRFPLHKLGAIDAMNPWELPKVHFEGTELEGIREADVRRMLLLEKDYSEERVSEETRRAIKNFLDEFFKEAVSRDYDGIRNKMGGKKTWGDIYRLYNSKKFGNVEKIKVRKVMALSDDTPKYYYELPGNLYAEVTLTVNPNGSELIDHDYFFILEEKDELQFEVVEMKEYGHPLVFENWSWGNPTQ